MHLAIVLLSLAVASVVFGCWLRNVVSFSSLISSSCVVILSNKLSSNGLPFDWRLLRSIIFYSHTSCDSFSCGLWDMNCVLVVISMLPGTCSNCFLQSFLPYMNSFLLIMWLLWLNFSFSIEPVVTTCISPLLHCAQCLQLIKQSERWQIGLYCNLQLCLHF